MACRLYLTEKVFLTWTGFSKEREMGKTILQIMSGIIQQNNRQIALIIFYNASLRVELPNCIAKSNAPCNSRTYYALKYGAGQTN